MKRPAWVAEVDGALVFQARFIGRDGGNVVVGTPRGGIYLGLSAEHVRWLDSEGPYAVGPGYRGRISVPLWLAKFQKVLSGTA